MWIRKDINIPDELIAAAKQDKLVLFVGAGVSCGTPSNLPTYRKLAEQLAEEQGAKAPTSTEPLDRFISMLPDRQNAHVRTLTITGDEETPCNNTHKAIVHLASSMKTPRIVTTNYDALLEQAAQYESIDLGRVSSAPMVPLGDSLDGLVHLHGGGKDGRPNELVLDDKDFGEAYLIRKWASQFLVDLFNTYSVVFIGYSLSDTIMQYLLGGLKSFAQPQFAFVAHNPADSNQSDYAIWEERGITPISYPLLVKESDPYVQLPQALDSLASYLQEDYATMKARIADLVHQNPPIRPEDTDYLVAALQTEDGAKCFRRLIDTHDSEKMNMWCRWILKQDGLSYLFSKDYLDTPAEGIMGSCILYDLPASKDFSLLETILQAFQSHIGAWFFHGCCENAINIAESQNSDAIKLLALLYSYRGNTSAHPPFACGMNLEYLAQAHLPTRILQWLVPLPTDSTDQGGLFLDTRDDDTLLPQNSPYLNKEFFHFVEAQLRDSYEVGNQLSNHHYAFIDRPAIEAHEQNYRFDFLMSICIETLRDYVWYHVDQRDTCINRWWQSGVPMLQRIALHTIIISEWNADAKLEWIIDHDLLSNHECHHEVFQLLANSINQTSNSCLEKLFKATLNLPDISGAQFLARNQYDILKWSLRHMDDSSRWAYAADWCATLAQQHRFLPRDHPDFLVWHEEATWVEGDTNPVQLKKLLDRNPIDFPSALLPDPEDRDKALSPKFSSILQWDIPNIISAEPELGIQLWERLLNDKIAKETVPQYFDAILSGWICSNSITITDKIAIVKLICISSLTAIQTDTLYGDPRSLVCAIRHYLKRVGDDPLPEKSVLILCDDTIQALWEECRSAPITLATNQHDDSVFQAMNTFPGEVTQYWIERLEMDFQKSESAHEHPCTDKYWNMLSELIRERDDIAVFTRAIVLSQIGALHEIDFLRTESLAKEIVGGPNNSDRTFIWNSLFPHIPLNVRLFLTIFFDSFIEEIRNMDTIPEQHLDFFFTFIIRMLFQAGMDQEQKNQIYRALTSHKVRKYNARFMQQTAHVFRQRTKQQRKRIWDEWLRDFITRRSQQEGGPWENEERFWFMDIIPLLGCDITQGMKLLEQDFPTFHNCGRFKDPSMLSDAISLDAMDEKDIAVLVKLYRTVISQLSPSEFHIDFGKNMEVIEPYLSEEQLMELQQLLKDRDIKTDFS